MSPSLSLVKLGHEAVIFFTGDYFWWQLPQRCVFGMRHAFSHSCKKATAHRGRWGAAAVASSDHRDVAGRLREVAVF